MKFDRSHIFEIPRPAGWKTAAKRAVLWMYERRLISMRTAQRLIDAMGARLA